MTEVTLNTDAFYDLCRKALKLDLITEIYPGLPNYSRDDFIRVICGTNKGDGSDNE